MMEGGSGGVVGVFLDAMVLDRRREATKGMERKGRNGLTDRRARGRRDDNNRGRARQTQEKQNTSCEKNMAATASQSRWAGGHQARAALKKGGEKQTLDEEGRMTGIIIICTPLLRLPLLLPCSLLYMHLTPPARRPALSLVVLIVAAAVAVPLHDGEANAEGQVIRGVGDAGEGPGAHLRWRGDGEAVRGFEEQRRGGGATAIPALGEEDVVDAVLDLLLLLLLGGAELPRCVEAGAGVLWRGRWGRGEWVGSVSHLVLRGTTGRDGWDGAPHPNITAHTRTRSSRSSSQSPVPCPPLSPPSPPARWARPRAGSPPPPPPLAPAAWGAGR